jgi:D-glycero-D-manno-heptose 1,7-bisphosphate phosphatase
LRNIKDFELLPGVAQAVKMINDSGYLCIVVTNQPVIARGEVTVPELNEIHNKMETLLGLEGCYVDAIYYCPHHPHKGYEGEIPELKIECECRKPKPGMLLKAAEDYNIDLANSWMVGDGANDIKAGKNAGCKTTLISDSDNALDEDIKPDATAEGLLQFVTQYIS